MIKVGDRVRVCDSVDGEVDDLIGVEGIVTYVPEDDGDFYSVTLEGDDYDTELYEGEIELV